MKNLSLKIIPTNYSHLAFTFLDRIRISLVNNKMSIIKLLIESNMFRHKIHLLNIGKK